LWHLYLLVAIDGDGDVSARDEVFLGHEEDDDEYEYDGEEYANAC